MASEHNIHSSYREMLLEHLFAGAVMSHLWLNGFGRVEVLKPQVDNSGYDIVLEANNVVRHIQLKASHLDSSTHQVNINVSLQDKPSGCVVWMYFNNETLELGPFLWLGGTPGEPLPNLGTYGTATHTKRNAAGVKTERPNIRVVPKRQFAVLNTIDDLVGRLFRDKKLEAVGQN